jgi:hypothetical protein
MKKVVIISLALAFIGGMVYSFCVCPSVYWEDTGEFITTSKNLGVAHPPGHPLYIVCSHLFLHFGNSGATALTVNLFSVFTSFLSIFSFSILLFLLFRHKESLLFYAAIFSAVFLFSFSKTFWYFTEIAEVYSLHTLLSILIFLSLFLFHSKGGKFILIFSYLFGLSLANNITLIYLLPAFAIFIILERDKLRGELIIGSILLFFVGISFYIYIPIRSQFEPVFNWGNAHKLKNFVSLVTASDFSKGFFALKYMEKTIVPFVLNFLREISFWGIIPLLFGFWELFKKNRNIFILIVSAVFFNVVLSFFTGRGPDFYAYFLPVIPLIFLTIGMGIMEIYNFFRGFKLRICVAIVLILSFLPLSLNYRQNCRRGDYDALNYGRSIVQWLSDNAILLAENTNDFFILTYLKEIENRNNFEVLYLPLFRQQWYEEHLESSGFKWKGKLTPYSLVKHTERECFYAPGAGISIPAKYLQPYGPFFKICLAGKNEHKNFFTLPFPRYKKGKKRYTILFSRFGEFYFKVEEYQNAINAYERAKLLEPGNPFIYHNLSVLYRTIDNPEKAELNQKIAEMLGYND